MKSNEHNESFDCSPLPAAIRACKNCEYKLPCGAKPIFQIHPQAKLLIASQAPGRVAHESGLPFMDKSGERLRDWLGLKLDQFYDPSLVAIVPMAFCYPGKAASGDLPPPPECAELWRKSVLQYLPNIGLSLYIGLYAQQWHLQKQRKSTLTKTVEAWRQYLPTQLPLPHPSPRNNIWLKKNAWFEEQVVPVLRERVQYLLK